MVKGKLWRNKEELKRKWRWGRERFREKRGSGRNKGKKGMWEVKEKEN